MSSITLIEAIAAVTGLLGAFLLAAKGKHAGIGWPLFLASNAAWLVFAWTNGHQWLLTQQIGFTGTSLLGIANWLIKKPDEPPNPWKEAILDQLARCSMDAPIGTPPAKILADVMAMAETIALDPAVSTKAQRLVEQGKLAAGATYGYVPGVMHCIRCKFQLNRITLNVADGNAYAGDNKTEPCPNGCGPLWPMTWEQEARDCWKLLEAKP